MTLYYCHTACGRTLYLNPAHVVAIVGRDEETCCVFTVAGAQEDDAFILIGTATVVATEIEACAKEAG